ncbi:hypothetical protein HMPREF9104_03340 [Lentilactobacillus kisonensis F0435]|uniref:Uncharacterized protein n=2 Tax=Lentilactobacillus kisonensis TaxID=481722 RepID=H1LL32_9LACO|nr:hypothetical protein HMPREF9104_03340 [Lentilactobacillus kisonensis F0435]
MVLGQRLLKGKSPLPNLHKKERKGMTNMDAKDTAQYVDLAMKNLHFMKMQRENVVSEVQRLMNHLSIEDVKAQLHK